MGFLVLQNVGKCFKDGSTKKWVFRHLNFSFPEKGMVGILGKSGCGKSTLLSLLSGLSLPSEGKIFYLGKNLASFQEKDWLEFRRKEVGLIFQHYNLIPGLSVYQNVVLPSLIKGPMKGSQEAESLLRKVGLLDKKNRCVDVLSGGEKQRTAICRALINSPRILLCDEPTGALDKENSLSVAKLLKSIAQTRLVILVTHDEKLFKPFLTEAMHLPWEGERK